MGAFIPFLSIMILALPTLVYAEALKLECNIKFSDFTDRYSIEVDTDKCIIDSTYHVVSNTDNSVAIDYKNTSVADINDKKIIFKAKLHSLDYTFEINRVTLEIIRYINDMNYGEAGRGSCNKIEGNAKKP